MIWDKPWVVMNDGRLGVIHHRKKDGKYGVRPINAKTVSYLPNPSKHWSEENRQKYPEELALFPEQFSVVARGSFS